jgi:hypothetical protein
MFDSESSTAVPGGRWAVGSYVSAWRQLCDAVWLKELEDPRFRRAVELATADTPGPWPDTHWLQREAWRDCIRSWWFPIRHHYATPADIPDDWLVDQREWEAERATASSPQQARAARSERRAATWAHAEALIGTGAFWPLHLDPPHLVRTQFETLREWAPLAAPERAVAPWWRA